jgi:MFS family permease
VYQAERAAAQTPLTRLLGAGRLNISRNVWCLGLTSLFTDVSSEMVSSILPAYLVLQLGFSPMAYGAIDGLYQGIGSLVRWISGAAADQFRRHKELAAAGYGVSALCRIGLLFAGNAWTTVSALVAVDRLAKGFRTAPRDALISLSSATRDMATAFGVHRALDALGALTGPLVAFLILQQSSRAFDRVFVISFSFALVGVAIIVLFVDNVSTPPAVARERAGSLLIAPLADARFRITLVVACLLALATISDAFIYLLLQRREQFGARIFPLLAAGTALSYTLLAVPAGRLADRIGRGAVFIGGHGALIVAYVILWQSLSGTTTIIGCVLLLGTYYAMTDGVLAAKASGALEPEMRGSGLAMLGTAVSVSRLAASMVFGLLWMQSGPGDAVLVFLIALCIGVVVAILSWRRLNGSSQ